jgi:NAD(P)H-dependent FMN reductase
VTGTTTILLVSGSLRHGSVNSAVLQTALAVAPDGIDPVIYDGLGDLPHFNPDDDVDPLPPSVAALRAAIASADAVLFCVPEYAGALPGSFKNLLDWTVGGGEIYEKPVAWINAAAAGRGVLAHESLRTVLGYTGSRIVDDACVSIPVDRATIGGDGLITDTDVRAKIAKVLTTLSGSATR